jgi:hypothetical protein
MKFNGQRLNYLFLTTHTRTKHRHSIKHAPFHPRLAAILVFSLILNLLDLTNLLVVEIVF